jgi:tRNA A37 methylthiotransferase MiaB
VNLVIADIRAAFDAHGFVKLVGQDIAAYGRDMGSSLPSLLRSIFEAVPGITLELGTLGVAWMKGMTREDLVLFADPRIRGNIHLPLQSASDSVLKRMRRGYTAGQFTSLLAVLRSLGITRFSTDMIAGFPGETCHDHGHNVAFLRTEAIAHAQIFAYDPRPGTLAASMHQVPRPIRVQRALELIGVFLTHSADLCRNENANINDFLNTNLELGKEEVTPSES